MLGRSVYKCPLPIGLAAGVKIAGATEGNNTIRQFCQRLVPLIAMSGKDRENAAFFL
jgi:hypothetical protein